MNTSPLYELHRKLGARFSNAKDWETVADYGDVLSEHRCVRSAAGLIDLSHRGKLKLTGEYRTPFLHGMITNDVKGLRHGQGHYAVLMTAQGQTLADLKVYCRPEYFLLDVDAGLEKKVRETLDRYLISEDVDIEDVTEQLSAIAISGRASGEVLGSILETDLSGLEPYGSAQERDHLVVRWEDTGEIGYVLYTHPEKAEEMWNRIQSSGKDVKPVGLSALDLLRMEAGIPVCGVDIEERSTPIESSIPHAVSLDKGCYVGQEVISKMTNLGKPRRHLVGFVFEGDVLPSAGDRVTKDEVEIGRVTSSIFSPSLNAIIAFGYVKRDCNEPGSQVEVLSEGSGMKGKIVETPFYKAPKGG